jgi:hypothetical protein
MSGPMTKERTLEDLSVNTPFLLNLSGTHLTDPSIMATAYPIPRGIV